MRDHHVRRVRRDRAVRAAVAERLLDPHDTPVAAFVDIVGIAETTRELLTAWPEDVDVLHAFAAKANALVPVLAMLRGQGLGCEVSSPGELAQARAAGFSAERLVLDSPAKSQRELEDALRNRIALNIDNFEELERVDRLVADGFPAVRVGVRINPQVGIGSIEAMSTAGQTTKFGVALADPGNRERLLRAYAERSWLRWVHVHVGSQGIPLELNAEGVAEAVAFAREVNVLRPGQVEGIDIGGGLPVDFSGDEDSPTFADHVATLRSAAPELFSGEFRIVTEYGRSVMAKNGFIASRVEYTKTSGGRAIALTHAGAQVAARTVFAPDAWPLRVLAYDRSGLPSTAELEVQDVAGPCCFAGDLLARERKLPLLATEDVVVVPDTGAYYFSSPFGYNSLPMPPVFGFEVTADAVTFRVLRPAESIDEVVARSGVL
jgi:diaminopimelate decarboxylase